MFSTGGTIASRWSDADGGFVAASSGDELVDSLHLGRDAANLTVTELAREPSSALSPVSLFAWAQIAQRELDEGADGVVVTIGTNALEEAAFLFDLTVRSESPVVFTGAMRTPDEVLSDGAQNLIDAIRVAGSDQCKGLGTLVVMNGEIHAARDVIKTDANGLDAFRSPTGGRIGTVARRGGLARIKYVPMHRQHIETTSIEPRVGYAKSVVGAGAEAVDPWIDRGYRGLVIEGFGGGEISADMSPAVERALESGLSVVVASRASRGGWNDLYASPGEGAWLRARGVLFAGDLSGPKARVKLMLALCTNDTKSYFD